MPKKFHLQRVRFSDIRTRREEQILRRGVKAGVAITLEAMRELHKGKAAESLEDGALTSLLGRDRRG